MHDYVLKFLMALLATIFASVAWWFIGGAAIPLGVIGMVIALYKIK